MAFALVFFFQSSVLLFKYSRNLDGPEALGGAVESASEMLECNPELSFEMELLECVQRGASSSRRDGSSG